VAEVKAIKDFFDRQNDMKLRKKGEVFKAETDRAKALEASGFVKSVEKKKAKETEENKA